MDVFMHICRMYFKLDMIYCAHFHALLTHVQTAARVGRFAALKYNYILSLSWQLMFRYPKCYAFICISVDVCRTMYVELCM